MYALFGVLCLIQYGTEVESSVLRDFSKSSSTASLVIRLTFCAILLFHMPYYFIPVKESVHLMYYEYSRKFLSQHIDAKQAPALAQ